MTFDITDDDLPDKELAEAFYAKYEPKEVLGRGVSSTVRRCVDTKTLIEYAVKIIDVSCERNTNDQATELRQSTKQEVNILRMCAGHPNIIELHDVFESSTFIFLVFELCKKGELFDYLTEVVTFSEKKTRQVMRQIINSLAFIHSKGIVHRDLKPENVLLDDDLNVKVTDFGFACPVVDDDDGLHELCGTPGYLAPEVLAVSMYDNAPGYGQEVDMWAIGVIMYTLLVGCPPFWHRKQIYMLRSIMEGKYEFRSPEWDDISDQPKDLISKLLVVDPKQRLTASQCLEHPFLALEQKIHVMRQFFPRRKFKAYVLCTVACHRIRKNYMNPPPISIRRMKENPYSLKQFRKLIDACAFRVYGHWVKKGEDQNRAALFEMMPRNELNHEDKPGLVVPVLPY
ncbi:phosphorylase b kinase gamma catalytic chain, skeletal muscle/heart isoform-like [Tubulanus polymorphus]|uniref:phosphorylase b kinase gamma catalytic chain, skeletal muscle/heart isoform-like n=1 Tax=Tubulanus polymorphus TaxID=672921 RepID=UPI003DA246E5